MKFRYAMVCSSNQNRSMEAHSLLKRHGFDVSSYGTGAHVKLPGPSLREPNVYDFGTPYKQMFDDLRRKDPELYPSLSLSLSLLFFFYNLWLLRESPFLSFFFCFGLFNWAYGIVLIGAKLGFCYFGNYFKTQKRV